MRPHSSRTRWAMACTCARLLTSVGMARLRGQLADRSRGCFGRLAVQVHRRYVGAFRRELERDRARDAAAGPVTMAVFPSSGILYSFPAARAVT